MADQGLVTPPTGDLEVAERWVIPADQLKQFRICMRIAVENAAEHLSQSCFNDPLRVVDDYRRLCRAGDLLDQVGWAHPAEEVLIEVATPPDVFGWAIRSALGFVTPAESLEMEAFIAWTGTLPVDLSAEGEVA